MRKLLVALLVVGALGALAGCGNIFTEQDPPRLQIDAHVVPNTTTVVFEASGTAFRQYRWDFGDGTTAETETPIIRHDYAEPGRYVVIVVAVGSGGSARPPGPGTPGNGQTKSAFVIVDLTRGEELRPVIQMINAWGEPASRFPGWTKVTFDSAGSWAPTTPITECAFRWRVVRIDPLTEEELGFPWGSDGELLEPTPFISMSPTVTINQIPGPSCSTSEVWTYKVTLEMWDTHNNYAVTMRKFLVDCQPDVIPVPPA